MKEKALVMCKVEAYGTESETSLTISEDFTWSMLYRGQKVSTEFCRLLKDVPLEINTGILLQCKYCKAFVTFYL